MLAKRIGMLWALALFAGYGLTSRASGITAAMRAEDKRLNLPVTLSERRIYLGQLLERLSKQTGALIFMNEQKPASGLQITIHCTKSPVADVLDAVCRLLSNQKVEWSWFRAGNPPSYNYQLFPPRDSADQTDRLRQYARMAQENYINLLIRLAYMSPEERRRNKHKITEALNQKEDTFANAIIDLQSMWDETRLFAEVTTPEQRLAMLRGEQEARVVVKDLSPATQALLHEVWAGYHSSTNGVPNPEPALLHFYAKPSNPSVPAIIPIIWCDLGEGSGSLSILDSVSLEEGIRVVIRKLWLLPGDTVDSPASQRAVVPTALDLLQIASETPLLTLENGKQIRASPQRPLDTRFSQLAQRTSLTVLALFPGIQNGDPGDPGVGHTVQGFLDRLANHDLEPMYKWRGNILLATYPAWFLEHNADDAVPYDIVKRYLLSKDGILTLSDLLGLFSSISQAQVHFLAQDHRAIANAAELFPICALFARFPELTSLDGLRLDADKLAALRAFPQNRLTASLLYGNAVAVRLSEQDSPILKRRALTIRAEMLSADGRWTPLYNFSQIAPPAKAQSQ